jgi:glycosyltransferase involved in cell wall biosynthesis
VRELPGGILQLSGPALHQLRPAEKIGHGRARHCASGVFSEGCGHTIEKLETVFLILGKRSSDLRQTVKIVFAIPPAEQRVGGLDSAIRSLRHALTNLGLTIAGELPLDLEPDTLVHFHGLWQPAHARLAKRCLTASVPYVVSPHGMLEPWAWRHKRWKKWPYFHLVEKGCLARAHGLLATGEPEARRLQQLLPRQRIETLPLGLTSNARPDYENARRLLGWEPEERVLLFLSRVHVKKGLDLLLAALATTPLPEKTRLIIVGDGEPAYVRSLRRFASENGGRLPPIEWVGAVWGEGRWPYFQGADLFCLPTHSENFGLAVLEACQVGTPALTTNETPWGDQLSGDRGFIGEPNVESVRHLLSEFFQQPRRDSRKRAALADWAHAGYDWKNLAPKYAAFYESILRAPSHRANSLAPEDASRHSGSGGR